MAAHVAGIAPPAGFAVGGVNSARQTHPVQARDSVKRLTVRMPAELHRRFARAAFDLDVTMNEIVLSCVEQWVADNESDTPVPGGR